jgi:hypothetical protein
MMSQGHLGPSHHVFRDITPLLASKDLGKVVASPKGASGTCRATRLLEVDVVDGDFACESVMAVGVRDIAFVLDMSTTIAELTLT